MVDQCNIVGNLLDSGINPIGASLEVTANSIIIDDTTTPDSVILPSPRTFTIPNTGVININLPPTEPSQTSYTFKLNAPGYFKEFIVSIPDQTSVEFASLLPTPFTQDRSVTGALRIAKEILTNPVTQPYVVEGLAIIRQEATPGAPTSPIAVWIKPSTGMLYTWDSTNNKWQSETIWQTVGSLDISATSTFSRPLETIAGSTQAKLATAIVRWSVGAAPNDASNRWSIQPRYKLSSSTTPVNVGSVILSTQGGYVPGDVGEVVLTPNTLLQMNKAEFVQVTATKTGSPSNLQVSVTYGIRYFA